MMPVWHLQSDKLNLSLRVCVHECMKTTKPLAELILRCFEAVSGVAGKARGRA